MNKLIGISTECLYYWVPQKNWLLEQIDVIKILKKYVSRIEMHFSVEDILNLNDDYYNLYLKETNGLSCSLHLPSFASEAGRLKTLLTKTGEIMGKLNIEYAVWHSDDFAMIEIATGKICPGFTFGLENSDTRKFGFQHLRDIALLGSYPIILDIDHIEEMKKDSLDTEIEKIKSNVIAIHFSTPSNKFFDKFPYIKTTHFPFSKSGNIIPDDLPNNIPLIIEGVFPNLEHPLIEEEVSLIENKYFR